MRLLKTNKKILFSSPYLIDGIMKTWQLGIGIEHREAIKTHSGFFLNLLPVLKEDILLLASSAT